MEIPAQSVPSSICTAISPALFPICSCETISPPKNPFPIPCETIENIGICATSPSIWIASAAAYTFPSPSLLHII